MTRSNVLKTKQKEWDVHIWAGARLAWELDPDFLHLGFLTERLQQRLAGW